MPEGRGGRRKADVRRLRRQGVTSNLEEKLFVVSSYQGIDEAMPSSLWQGFDVAKWPCQRTNEFV